MNLKKLMKTKVNLKKMNKATKAILHLNILFSILIYVYWSFAKEININVLVTMIFFEIIYLIVSSGFVIAQAYNK